MEYGVESAEMIRFDRVFLDLKNPRHDPFKDQNEVIEYLCREEKVLELARDIAEKGTAVQIS